MGISLVQREVLLYESLQFSRVVVQDGLMDGAQGGGELVVLLCESLDTEHKAGVTRGVTAGTGDTSDVYHQEARPPWLGQLHWLGRPT